MSLNVRIKRLERQQNLTNGMALIFLEAGETNEEAYRRTYQEGSKKPKTVVYIDPINGGYRGVA
jgi:hypothetical protein